MSQAEEDYGYLDQEYVNYMRGGTMAKSKAKEAEVIEPEKKTDALARRHESAPALPTDINVDDVSRKFEAIRKFQVLVQKQLKENIDYGVIPGTSKPTLYKAGAEKISKLLDLSDIHECVESIQDWDRGFFMFRYKTKLVSLVSGQIVSEGVGSCNSKEDRYRWRWVSQDKLPPGSDPAGYVSRGSKQKIFEFGFAIQNGETSGKYGKPAEYWEKWREAIRTGKARETEKLTKKNKMLKGYEITVDRTLYRIPNEDIFTQVNTIEKMAKKRSMVDAGLSVGRLSELFTQDLEDTHEREEEFTPEYDEPEEQGPASSPAPEEGKPDPKGGQEAIKSRYKGRPKVSDKDRKDIKPPPAEAPASPEEEEPLPPDPEAGDTEDPLDGDNVNDGNTLAGKKTDARAETIKAIQEHLKVVFGKNYDEEYKLNRVPALPV
jgi:hypothetical protein